MKGTNLGELEELVMLSVGILYDDAYGLAIQKEIKERCKRSITISTVHSVTSRLEEKGYLSARYDGATPERGGRRKRLFQLTTSGKAAITRMKEMRDEMWKSMPEVALTNG
ncbi:MAG: PadR family transcriptional regulator [Ekhidna sp.]|uniref:PadR family transcriptional regulator n=1 Tax=Ekhidna sp. TaxID=2608089 RepID=UPI0032EF84A7